MSKKIWAKGRKEPHCTIAVCSESRDMANRLAQEAGMSMKEFIYTLLDRYDIESTATRNYLKKM
jgi:tyrosyl-tRNA synthetase